MSGILKSTRFQCAAILITACLLCATAASAEQIAQIGHVYPDGTVQLDLSRFTQTISTGPQTSAPVADTLLEISNGLLYAVRLADDDCKSERVQLQVGTQTSSGPSFTPLAAASGANQGWHPNGSQVASSSSAAPLFALTVDSINWHLFECVDDGCRNRYDGACVEISSNSSSGRCVCVYVEPPNPFDPPDPFELPELEMTSDGCKRQISFRNWWSLYNLIHPIYIQNN